MNLLTDSKGIVACRVWLSAEKPALLASVRSAPSVASPVQRH